MTNQTENYLLNVEGIKRYFPVRDGLFSKTKNYIYAVDGVSFNLKKGETLGLVGESGCGKSTLGRVILRLTEPTEGKVIFKDQDIFSLNKSDMRKIRRSMQIIFQDPYSSLNPRMRVGNIVGEPIDIHQAAKGKEKEDMVVSILKRVGLDPEDMKKYPHEFSGGQRQRIGIARAIILNPELIIADEPVSSLDLSVQAQVINLMQDLQDEFNLSYVIISHDLSVVEHMSDRIAVMYLGRIVEMADSDDIFHIPLHPYTEALFSAIPTKSKNKKRIILQGEIPSPMNPPSGCPFHPRCFLYEQKKNEICVNVVPQLKRVTLKESEHFVSCHLRESGK